ncbi:cuticle protein 7-like [Pollicipes pollicipes]|uniref:cuticle protein 7-like n=1 Tax=Pollicipes pollicipes TaxID=41117 RepID=UPI0018859C18|nr:cuticle protein 7-like [Pollicipes pollicipes]
MQVSILLTLLAAAHAQYTVPLVNTQLGYSAPVYTTYGGLGAGYGYNYGYANAMPMAYGTAAVPVSMSAVPLAYGAAGVAMPVAKAAVQSHAQDELGQYNYGYATGTSAKKEVKTADGVVRGSYSYVDAYGQPQHVKYVSDALGFRVQATNLPVGPAAGAVLG